jgi:eukaryotic-like serine/threonine-protein kinase
VKRATQQSSCLRCETGVSLRPYRSGRIKKPLPDNIILSHYRILSRLGAVGMGEVYLAEDTKLDRKVAIKFLTPEALTDEKAKSSLIREARAAAKLDHTNICSIYEVDEQDGQSFIVMQYIEGETLATRMLRQPLDLKEFLDVATQVADALVEAHSRAIIHRDIKPANIMITSRGQVKMMDFGLAKLVEQQTTHSGAMTQSILTKPGTILGTVPYMSPEQLRGERVDARSDIFSFGALLYEMVSGHQPFASGSAAATTSAILTREPQPLARYSKEVPPELERIVSKAICKDKEKRYQVVKDLALDLKSLREELEFKAKVGHSISPDLAVPFATTREHAAVESADQPTVQTRYAAAPATSGIIADFKRHKGPLILAIGALAIAVGAVAWFTGGNNEGAIDSLAILPFVNVGADSNTEYLADGITESLISSLSQLTNLKVMSRSSVFRYKGREMDPQAVARELKVQAVLAGRIVSRGDSLAISLELVDARDNRQLWGEQYNRKFSDALAVQREISREVSEKLRLSLSRDEKGQLAKHQTENSEAYQLYLRGRFHFNKYTEEAVRKGIDYFHQALDKDPTYALAYVGLADSYIYLGSDPLPPKEAFPQAKAYAEKALALNPALAEAHGSLGQVKLLYEWDWAGAERELQPALGLNPKGWTHSPVIYTIKIQ